jgi:hypothetical protein
VLLATLGMLFAAAPSQAHIPSIDEFRWQAAVWVAQNPAWNVVTSRTSSCSGTAYPTVKDCWVVEQGYGGIRYGGSQQGGTYYHHVVVTHGSDERWYVQRAYGNYCSCY